MRIEFRIAPRIARDCRAARGARVLFALLALGVSPLRVPGATPPPPAAAKSDGDDLYRLGRELFSRLPEDIREQFDFPTREEWDAFMTRFQQALAGDSLQDLASYVPDARNALRGLRLVGGYDDLADWLEQRLDELEGAQQAIAPPPPAPKAPPRPAVQPVPHYRLWLARVQDRPVPARAAAFLPRLRAAFVAEGLPAELVWLAEAESSFNPAARSPVGAKGLFQFMPETAKAMGLSTSLPDERTDPEKSARAAARYLRILHGKFGNWALALAAYNAGEGRVSRTLASKNAKTFSAIASALPAETQMYVPKVCALIATRAGVTPDRIPPPRPR